MPVYAWKGRNKMGKTQEGTLTADSKDAVIALLDDRSPYRPWRYGFGEAHEGDPVADEANPDCATPNGDEFAIVIADAQSRKKVEQLADSIIRSIKEPYMIDQTEIRIGVSIGCAFGPIDGQSVDDLIQKADLALYQAKDAGRGVARYFSSELQTEQDDRVRLEADLRQAIAAKQFHLLFQPLVSAKTQKLVGFEALIRWNHPQRGFVPPNVFIPVAEESGLMPVIGEWVIEEAVRAAISANETTRDLGGQLSTEEAGMAITARLGDMGKK